MYVEFKSVTLFTVLYSRFLNCAKDVSKVTAQPTILEFGLKNYSYSTEDTIYLCFLNNYEICQTIDLSVFRQCGKPITLAIVMSKYIKVWKVSIHIPHTEYFV